MNRVSAALALRKLGWNVVAAPPKAKKPIGSWKRFQTEIIPDREVRTMFSSNPDANLFVITGSVSRLAVLDCDDEQAYGWWKDKLGDIIDATTAVKSSKGYHFYFRLKPGQIERGRSHHGDGPSGEWDLRCEGNGVIVPPSVHESGHVYAWVEGRDPKALKNAPKELFEAAGAPVEQGGGGEVRSMLSQLLSNPPAEGGRNNWLARVAGHYAKHLPHYDAYDHLVRDAAGKLNPPLPDDEVEKLIPSIWRKEQEKKGTVVPEVRADRPEEETPPDPAPDGAADEPEAEQEDDSWRRDLVQPKEETGWLVSGDTRILVQVKQKDSDGHAKLGLATWMDADLRVLGVIEEEGNRVYEVELRRPNGERFESALPASVIADPRRLAAWLANYGVGIAPPDDMWPVKAPSSTRLTRYLEAQDAPALVGVPALGWHDESQSFITHEGVIRAEGRGPFENVRPVPALRNWAPYRYGFSDEKEAQSVLREVLEFHYPEVTAVFGAWWAAAILKPQVLERVSQFPFMALEATSESGKTTGYFSLMMQLGGNKGGQSNPTRAALRDYLSAHRSGIVWVDDLDDLEAHGELLRNVTVGGSLIKKGEGNHQQVVAVMRSSLVVSGEALGLEGQKALLDRAIQLDVPSPTDRLSRDGSGPQWDDILGLRERHPDLSVFAGTLVQLALRETELMKSVKDFRMGTGRFADKMAVVRMGARLLHKMAGEGSEWVVKTVDEWATGVRDPGSENTLTLKLLPTALQRTGWVRNKPHGPDPERKAVATPAFVEVYEDGQEIVWFSPSILADWWEREPPFKRTSLRVESAKALEQQARKMGLGGGRNTDDRKQWKFDTNNGRAFYWRCPKGLSAVILARSRGDYSFDYDGIEEEKQDGEDQGSLLQ